MTRDELKQHIIKVFRGPDLTDDQWREFILSLCRDHDVSADEIKAALSEVVDAALKIGAR